MGQPSAHMSVRRQGRDRAVIVTTSRGDAAGSHQAAYDAIRKARIRPSIVRARRIEMTFDPAEIGQTQAEALVEEALRQGGVRVHR